MLIKQSFKALNRYLYIIFIPIAIDLAALFAGLRFLSFYEVTKPSLMIIYEIGLPSLSHILSEPLLANTLKYLSEFEQVSSPIVITVLVFIMINSLGQGAYIGILFKIANKERLSFRAAISDAKRFWLRFFMFAFIFMLLQMTVVLFLMMFLKVVGIFASLMLFLFLRVFFMYFEYCMVIYNCFYGKALSKAYEHFKEDRKNSLIPMAAIFVTAGLLSFVLHQFWSLGSLIFFIIIYSYIMTILQLALMMNLRKIINEE